MSKAKKLISAFLVLALCLSCAAALSACRVKDETVITFKNGDLTCEIKAGTYLCNLMAAYSEFRSEYDEAVEAESQTVADDINYEKETLEEKNYSDWVVDKCYERCAMYAYVETECERLGLALSKEEQAYAEQVASYYWATGNQSVYEPNGVSYATYLNYYINQQYKNSLLYDYYYGEHTDEEKAKDENLGSKRPSDDEIKKYLTENYLIADTLSKSLTSSDSTSSDVTELSDEEKEAAKKEMQALADRYNSGTAFSELYNEFNNTTEVPESDAEDKYATVYASSETGSTNAYYDELAKQTVGKAVVLEFSDCYMLAVKQDISKDSYYFDTYKDTIVSNLKSEEFYDFCIEKGKELKAEKNQSAINFYKPSKIKISES